MNKNLILVAAHPRSGTHFVINSICMNFKNVEFPLIRNAYASLEGLFLTHDREYTREWEKWVREDSGKTKVFKTHLTPSDLLLALNNKFYLNEKEEEIINTIYKNSKIVYVHRDGRDVLVSWYYYQKNDGGGLSAGGKLRLNKCGFSEFIRMPNKYFMPIRGLEERDRNRVKYWSSHINEWLAKEDAVFLRYESLIENFEKTIKNLGVSLGIEKCLVSKIKKPGLQQFTKSDIWSRGLRKAKRTFAPFLSQLNIKVSNIVPPAYPRKGIVGDWKSHFSDSDLEFFWKFAEDTMSRLGYKT